MTSQKFVQIINEFFVPFLHDMGFRLDSIEVNGRFYLARFKGSNHLLNVCFEPGEDYLSAQMSTNGKDIFKVLDDPKFSPKVSELNRRFMGAVTNLEFEANNRFFESATADDPLDRKLIKIARDLRLVLPKFLASLSSNS